MVIKLNVLIFLHILEQKNKKYYNNYILLIHKNYLSFKMIIILLLKKKIFFKILYKIMNLQNNLNKLPLN